MVSCPVWEERRARLCIATRRYQTLTDSFLGMDSSTMNPKEEIQLEHDMREALRALLKHDDEHNCRG
jgi:hypothetical protein